MSARVLLSDKLAAEGVHILEQCPELQVDNKPGLDPAELKKIIGVYDGIVIRSGTKLTADALASAGRLRAIGRAGIGVDNVDVEAASKRGIVVMNTPGGNNVTTAEHTVSLMLALARHIPQANASMRAGEWRRGDFVGTELCDKILGVVGLGNIGSIVADRARGLKMRVIAYDPFLTEEAARRLGIELVALEEVYSRADFITVHVPMTNDTTGLIDDAAIAKMKPGVRILNCARGGIVDEAALLRGLDSGKVAGAGLDVFINEPPGPEDPLVSHPLVVATPHLGASTDEAQLNVAISIAEQIRDFFVHGIVTTAVNVPSLSAEEADVLAPYILLAEKIGSLHSQLSPRAPSEIIIAYRGEIADADCRAVNAAVLKGMLSHVLEANVNAVNAPVLARERGIRLVELKEARTSGYANSVQVTFQTPEGPKVIEGAVFGRDIVRLVRFNDFYLEAVPEGDILVLHNRDVPGVVGNVGTFLAKLKVNIAGLELGRVGGEAISFVHVDTPLDRSQLEQLKELPDITGADMVNLG